jgi:hypothetical protein
MNLAAALIAGLLATFMLSKVTGDSLSAAIVVLVLLVTAAALFAPPARGRQAQQRK